MRLELFFEELWKDYIKLAPQAEKIMGLFESNFGTPVINDHVAFRTFAKSEISIEKLTPILQSLGYSADQQYQFPTKKLIAISYAHPSQQAPLIFLSELLWWELSSEAQNILKPVIDQISTPTLSPELFYSGLHWEPISINEYSALAKESEYASWLAAHGLHANHFTISLNHLKKKTDLSGAVSLLENEDIELNAAGGIIKGLKSDLLRQASTMAPDIEVSFSENKSLRVPGCYYEFAERFPMQDGSLFKGFVPASADKIFESTHRQTKAKSN